MSREDFEPFKDVEQARKDIRREHGRPCPECVRFLPKASPTILIPGQRCTRRGHNYHDPRQRTDEHDPYLRAGFEKVCP